MFAFAAMLVFLPKRISILWDCPCAKTSFLARRRFSMWAIPFLQFEYQGVCLQLEAWAVVEAHMGVIDGSNVLSKPDREVRCLV